MIPRYEPWQQILGKIVEHRDVIMLLLGFNVLKFLCLCHLRYNQRKNQEQHRSKKDFDRKLAEQPRF